MNYIIEKTTDLQNWDSRLKEYKGSVFLSSSFLESLKDDNKIPVYFKFKNENQTIAVIAGFERPVGVNGSKQLFFYSGIASSDDGSEVQKSCKQLLLDYAIENSYQRVIMKSYDYNNYVPARLPQYNEFRRAECVIDLIREIDEIHKGFTKNVRRLVKRARNLGGVFKQGRSKELFEKLFELLESTKEKRVEKGYGSYTLIPTPLLNRENMFGLLQDGVANLYYIEYQGEIVCMQYNIASRCRSYVLLMGTSPKGYKISAPSLLFYEVTMRYKDKGFVSYNMGGVPIGNEHDGVRKFKMTMGADLIESSEEFTDFLLPPLIKLNKVMKLKRWLNNLSIPWRIRKPLIRLTDFFIKGRDEY